MSNTNTGSQQCKLFGFIYEGIIGHFNSDSSYIIECSHFIDVVYRQYNNIAFSDSDSVDNNEVDSPLPRTIDTQEVSMTFSADTSKDFTQNSSLKTISTVIGSQENSFGHKNPLFSTFNGNAPKSNLINGLQASDI